MNALLSLGRWIFPVSFSLLGLSYMMNADTLAGKMPGYLPAPTVIVYLTGLLLVGAGVSMLIGKYDKLAAALLGILFLLIVIILHLSVAMAGHDDAMGKLLRDLGLAGAAFIYAKYVARDASIVG